jgi:truncated hemoglobin YjbI
VVAVAPTRDTVLAGLADAIAGLLADDAARTALADRARARARELPDADATRDAALAAYRILLGSGPDDC